MLNHLPKMNRQQGLTMIESMISLLVISVGLLGIAGMQVMALKQTTSAQFNSQAVWFNYEMTDRINANRSAFDDYIDIDTNDDFNMDCVANNCTPAQMVEADAQQWKQMVDNLPEGRGFISSPAANRLTISVYWNDDSDDETNCPDDVPDRVGKTCYSVTMTNIPGGP
ncbi:MAG: type IV pilus modification protein PilV [Gammaproteobacteria bacterium]|nr:type IV pilus modification protein PilV [Gammaproteobacteria bacterium]